MKRKFLIKIFFLILCINTIKSQDFERSPEEYAVFGFVPGLGQFLLGNYITGATQLGLFLTFMGSAISLTNRPDYIPPKERKIQFKIEEAIIADYLEKNNFLYKEYPFLSESIYDRYIRIINYKKLIEINPLVEYGEYERMTYATSGNELLGQSAQHVLFYSVYSSYRDAGGISNSKKENYLDLAFSSFNPKFIFNKKFLIPISLALIITGYETSHPPKNPEITLLYPGMKRSGYMNFYTGVLSFNAGVSEEAFFRGFINHYLIHKVGLELGILSSSLIFGAAHLGNSLGNAIFATFFGAYLGYLHYKENWDIRQGIAIHFWWDVIIIASTLRYTKEDPNILKNSKEISFMPIYYIFKF